MPAHAAVGNAALSASNDAIDYSWVKIAEIKRDRIGSRGIDKKSRRGIDDGRRRQSRTERLGLPVIRVQIFFMPSAEETQAQAEVHRQLRRDMPVVLEIRLAHSVAIVIAALRAILLIGTNAAVQEIRECIAGGLDAALIGEGQDTLQISRGRADGRIGFVLLRQNHLKAEEKRVLSQDLGDVISEAVGRVGMVVGDEGRIHSETVAAVGCVCSADNDTRDFPAKAIVE